MIAANGPTTTDGYDHLGWPVTTTLPAVTLYTGGSASPAETTQYDGDGNVIKQVDGNGDVTSSAYDPLGRLVVQTNPVAGTSVYTANATEQTAVQDPQGNVTADQYDAAGRLITQTAPISGTTLFQYDAVGNTTAITQADASTFTPVQVETRQYDALNRVITDTASGPGSVSLTTATRYDHDGNVYQVVRPAGDAVVNTYDLADDPMSTEVDTATVRAATLSYNALSERITDTAVMSGQVVDSEKFAKKFPCAEWTPTRTADRRVHGNKPGAHPHRGHRGTGRSYAGSGWRRVSMPRFARRSASASSSGRPRRYVTPLNGASSSSSSASMRRTAGCRAGCSPVSWRTTVSLPSTRETGAGAKGRA